MAIRFLLYGALGWCGEIVWTAVTRRVSGSARDWLLIGETSLWSFPMYGLGGLAFEWLHNALRDQFFLVRALVYLLAFWTVEYVGGWLVLKLTRKMPWDYSRSRGGSLHGLIRWNFVFLWPWVGLAFEPVHDFLVRLVPVFEQAMK